MGDRLWIDLDDSRYCQIDTGGMCLYMYVGVRRMEFHPVLVKEFAHLRRHCPGSVAVINRCQASNIASNCPEVDRG